MCNKKKCPMDKWPMSQQLPMMNQEPMMYQCPMMQQPMMQQPMYDMPNEAQMPMEMDPHMEDEKDDKYFMGMYTEISIKMMSHVIVVLDDAEVKGMDIYNGHPEKNMVKNMGDVAYGNFMKDMPNMSNEMEKHGDKRQYVGDFGRELIGVLLLNEIFRRRRRRRYDYGYPGYQEHFGYPGYGGYREQDDYSFDDDDDFYFYE